MILDRLENAEALCTYGKELVLAFDYLRRTDFSRLGVGRHPIDGDRVYAMVQRYQPKPISEAKWEAHRKYLDVQYVASGSERIGYAPLRKDMPVKQEYDADKDYILYDADGDFFAVRAGGFAIFGPQDVHAPCLLLNGSAEEVCKVVVKCRLPG